MVSADLVFLFVKKISKKYQKTIDKCFRVCYNDITVKHKGGQKMITVRIWGNIYEVTLNGKKYEFDTEKDMLTCLEMLQKFQKKGGAK